MSSPNPAPGDIAGSHLAVHSVDLADGSRWEPCHTWVENTTTWVDAYWTDNLGQYVLEPAKNGNVKERYLDVGCAGDDCCVDQKLREQAQQAWNEGGVLVVKPYEQLPNITAIIAGQDHLNTKIINEALRRFSRTLTGA